MFEGVNVTHKAWGIGMIKSVKDGYITVDFSGTEKTLVFPDSIGKFLQSSDDELLRYAADKMAEKNKKIEEQKEAERKKTEEKILPQRTISGDDSDYETPLLGKRSGDIVFSSEEAFYEVVGYLAKPGRIAFYQAELTEDKESQFNQLFPNQDYKVIKSNYGANGMPTKQGCQFRINLASIVNCPDSLLKHISEKNGNWAGRINRSKFALRLVQYNGFRFGHTQNVEEIRERVPQKYIEAFNRGYSR